MSILIDSNTRVVIQGITGRQGLFHGNLMQEYGTNIVAGVTPGRGGQIVLDNVPVFDAIADVMRALPADQAPNCALIVVPARFAADAIFEAADAAIPLIVCLTEHIPVQDMIKARDYVDKKGVRLLGPNCPGLITAGQAKVGIIPGDIVLPGPVGVVSRSGTLTYEVVYALTTRGIGQTTCVGIGGDPVNGTDFIAALRLFEADPETKEIIMIGEIGGNDEEKAAAFIKDHVTKPVTAFIAGRTAPAGRTMGHAGAIVEGSSGTAAGKVAALAAAGVPVADHPEQVAEIVAARLLG